MPRSLLIQFSDPSQIRCPRICPNLIPYHLIVLIKVERICECLIPFLVCDDPRELSFTLHCDLSFLHVHYILCEPHVPISEMFLQKLKVGLYALEADEFAAQKRREEGLAVFNDFGLGCTRKVGKNSCKILLGSKVIAKALSCAEQTTPGDCCSHPADSRTGSQVSQLSISFQTPPSKEIAVTKELTNHEHLSVNYDTIELPRR